MNPLWALFAILSASLAIVYEFWMAHTERKTRQLLEQPLSAMGRLRNRLVRSLFFTTILCLLFGLFLAGAHKQWSQSLQGVALVVDTAVQMHSSSDRLAIEKAAVVELIRSLPGETFSLWELRGEAVLEIVPPTVDRLFLEVQLDGLLPSSPSGTRPSLSSVRDAVAGQFSGIAPWVVCFTRSDLSNGHGTLDGAASIVVSMQSTSCHIAEEGLEYSEPSIEETGTAIARRLSRAFTTTPLDRTESWLLSSAALISLLCCLTWRRAVPPIALLGFLFCFSLEAISPTSANHEARQAIDIATNGDFPASEEYIDAILTNTNDPQARGRLLYDRALLAYLQGRDADALQWITMEPSTLEREPIAAQTLRGMALIRLVRSSPNLLDETARKEALAFWLDSRPPVGPTLIASASLVLITPSFRIRDIDLIRRSLFWFEENGSSSDMEAAANLLTQGMNGSIKNHFDATWPKSVGNNFLNTVQSTGPHKVSALRIWYDFASTATPNDGISFLFNQASASAQAALYFPDSSARADLALVSSLLPQLVSSLPEGQQPLLKKLLSPISSDMVRSAAEWYARSVVWPAVAGGKDLLKPLAIVLFREGDIENIPLIRQSLASLAQSLLLLPQPSSSSGDSLETVVRQLLAAYYAQDSVDALDAALEEANRFPALWGPRLSELVTPGIRRAMNGTEPIPRAVGEAIGGSLPQTDVELSVRVWQIAISRCTTPQETERYVDHLTMLFSELAPKLATPSDSVYRSLVLIYSVQPFILEQLQTSGVFQKNPTKRALYDQLLSEWEESCSSVEQRLAEPISFRLPRVRQEVETSIGVLHRLQALLREGEAVQTKQPPRSFREGTAKAPSVHGEDAVRLFQELDRSDRSL